jgi:hypothetical protein
MTFSHWAGDPPRNADEQLPSMVTTLHVWRHQFDVFGDDAETPVGRASMGILIHRVSGCWGKAF